MTLKEKGDALRAIAKERGWPVKEYGLADPTELPDWFKAACENPRILFFDELNWSTLEVAGAITQIADSKKNK